MRYFLALTFFAATVVLSVAAQDVPQGSYQQTCKNIRMRSDALFAKCKNSAGRWVKTSLNDAGRCTGDITNLDGQLQCGGYGHPERDAERGAPAGSYTATCNRVRVDRDSLRAACQNSSGQWVETSLDNFQRCTGDITNVEGQLHCGGYGHPERAAEHGAPPGSYTQTCNGIRVEGDNLQARCQTSDGRWVDTSLDYDHCAGDIVNDEGRLDCTRAGGPGVPPGSYSQTCRRIYLRGNSLRAQCETTNGQWVWTQLDGWNRCGGISNQNGQLSCDR